MGLGGNCVSVSNGVWTGMVAHGAPGGLDPMAAGKALKRFIDERAANGLPPLRFAVTHPHSGHNYELRYWLRGSGTDPNRDVEIVIVPPPFMADAMAAGRIDGYCVGEPWNSVSVVKGTGRIATVKAAIWKNSPEKVLGVGKAFAESEGAALSALLRALHRAAPHQTASFCNGDTPAPVITDVVAFLGRCPCFRAPFRNSISRACLPTSRSRAAIPAS
jgi:NitT/TauT family transport system ATP-binding protein